MAIAVEGLRPLIRDLEKAGVALEDIKDVFAEIADEASQVMAGIAPVKSGDLRRSIRGNRAKNKAVVTAGNRRVKYARPINYGWAARGIRAVDFTGKTDAVMDGRSEKMLIDGIDKLLGSVGLDVD